MKKLNLSEKWHEYTGVILLVWIAFMIFLFTGCGVKYKQAMCRKWNVCPTIKDSVRTEIKDSICYVKVPVVNPADNATLLAYLRCDSLGNVYIDDLTYMQGRVIDLEAALKNNVLNVTATKPIEVDTAGILAKFRTETTYKERIVEKQVNILTKCQTFLNRFGLPSMILNLLFILYFAYRLYRRLLK